VILLTGVGTRYLVQAISRRMPQEEFVAALRSATTVARGPKSVAALRELGLKPTISVPEPNTWREVLVALDERLELRGQRVAVQEYGERNPKLLTSLEERGADVSTVPIYRWSLPEDPKPLREAVRQILAGQIDVSMFMSAVQVDHLFQVAGAEDDPLREAFERVVVASIGPVFSIAVKRHGLTVDIEPDHPKMGSLVTAIASRAPALVRAKRS
jgi:uroporphyrinogen-III synthase